MKPPKDKKYPIEIIGKPWTLHIEDNLSVVGQMRFNPLEIVIASGVSPAHHREVMLHEIIEAVNADMALGLTEQQIAPLSLGLHSCRAIKVKLPWE